MKSVLARLRCRCSADGAWDCALMVPSALPVAQSGALTTSATDCHGMRLPMGGVDEGSWRSRTGRGDSRAGWRWRSDPAPIHRSEAVVP